MATNISVFDLVNAPGTQKTVTVDLTEVVPTGNNGEDIWVFTASTTATASGGAAIQKLYINNTKLGWIKSSGLKTGPYDILSGARHLRVAIDENIANAVQIALETNALPVSGEDVAKDIQNKINATARTGGSKLGNLSYLNAVVKYSNNTFTIISGVPSSTYSGSDRSSVAVADGTTTTGLAAILGFNITVSSEVLDSTQVKETSVASPYTAPSTTLVLSSAIASTGDVFSITDGTNREYRGITTAIGATLTLASGLANNYAAGSKVQILREQDASGEPPSIYTTIDDYIKFGISYIVNQIFFG